MSARVPLRVRRLPHAEGLPLPRAMSPHAAGLDVVAACEAPVRLAPGDRALVPTGLVLEVPPGYEVQVRARSGLALRHGLSLVNGVGTIDADYRGEVGVILQNHGRDPFEIERGMRIAQLVVAPVVGVEVQEVETLGDTERGAGGFGSTGAGEPSAGG